MNVSKQSVFVIQQTKLTRKNFFHFDDQFTGFEYFFLRREDPGPFLKVHFIGKPCSLAGIMLNVDIMPGIYKPADVGRDDCNTVFVFFPLFGQTNFHREKLRATAPVKQLSVGRPADFAAPKELLCGKRKPMHPNEKISDRPKTAR